VSLFVIGYWVITGVQTQHSCCWWQFPFYAGQ